MVMNDAEVQEWHERHAELEKIKSYAHDRVSDMRSRHLKAWGVFRFWMRLWTNWFTAFHTYYEPDDDPRCPHCKESLVYTDLTEEVEYE